MTLLEIRKVSKNFGGLSVLNDISFNIDKGEILGIIGPNGAGKTTLFNVISGVYKPPFKGEIVFKGEHLTGFRPSQIAKRGLVRTFQDTRLFGELSMLENIVLGCHLYQKPSFWGGLFNTPSYREGESKIYKKAQEIMSFMGLRNIHGKASMQPLGHQRALGIGVALAAEPKLLLLDEPVSGMNRSEINNMVNLIQKIRDNGITIMLVEHDMHTIMELSHRIVVLNYGRKIAEGNPKEISKNEMVIEAYLGANKDDVKTA